MASLSIGAGTLNNAKLPSLVLSGEQVSKSDVNSQPYFASTCTGDHEFRNIYCDHCGKQHAIPMYCGDRFCEICGVQRRLRVRDRLRWIITQVKPTGLYGFKFLTLTIANQPNPGEMCRHLLKSFRRMRQRKLWKEKVRGGAFVLEVKEGSSGWHVHIHAVLEAQFIAFKDLLKEWNTVSGGQGVYIKKAPLGALVKYLTKYLSKPCVDLVGLEMANTALKGLRLFNPFGTWFHLNKTYPKHVFVCPECGNSSWMYERQWEKLIEYYGSG